MAACVVLSLLWHVWQVRWTAWPQVEHAGHARDFASYYYAARAAQEGLDPYDKRALTKLAKLDETRASVHPFLYPPPFLLVVRPFTRLTLLSAYHQWFVLTELCGVLAVLTLALWWRPLHWAAPAVLFLLLAAITAVPNNLIMGQANFPVLLLLVLALILDARDQPIPAGVLLGAACMAKMSPALFVLWWLVQGRWKGALSAVCTAVVLSVLTLPVLGAEGQLRFYTDVLPQFASGRYNGLSVPIGLFGNHSLPDLLNQLLPGEHDQLSTEARWLARLLTLVLLGGTGWAFRRPADAMGQAGQACAIAILMLLLPVYTYEHHLVWALPAAAWVAIALLAGRLPRWAAGPAALAVLALAWDLQQLKWAAGQLGTAGWLLQEVKFVGLCGLFGLCAGGGISSARGRV